MKKLFLLLLLAACSKPPAPVTPPPYVTVVEPKVEDVPLFYEYIGHVEPNQSARIKPQAQGIIIAKYFTEGQEVQQNDLLLTIDPAPYQAELDRVSAELAQNLATLRQAKDTVERYSALVQDAYVSQLDYDRYVTNAATADASVQQSLAAVEKAQIDLSYCTITAPFKGVTSKLQIDVGNYVPIGGYGDTENIILVINQISPIRVSFYVPEKDLPRITALQQQNTLKTTVILNDECIEGALYLINNEVDEKTGTILLQALFTNEDQKLWPGEYLNVRLILETKKDAILLPKEAVQIGQDGPYVYVVKSDNTVELRKVKPGQKEEEQVIVESGVAPGETVVLEGQLNLYPGAKVVIK
ncbi:MAG TPA: efflux RND transporter periplasmic adaptor subunit [Rhabdochlamydiaceae bacterium]|nr:efflux RND transporter periplasmic adaptor subunit [Rhabdochlamydiaceae bacterium]